MSTADSSELTLAPHDESMLKPKSSECWLNLWPVENNGDLEFNQSTIQAQKGSISVFCPQCDHFILVRVRVGNIAAAEEPTLSDGRRCRFLYKRDPARVWTSWRKWGGRGLSKSLKSSVLAGPLGLQYDALVPSL